MYRYLYKPGQLEDDNRLRATEMIWSWNTFRIDRIVKIPGQRVLYYLADGAQIAFVHEELKEVPVKPQNIRDLIRRKVGNDNTNYLMKNVKALPLDYLSYMVKSMHTFRHYNIAPETLEKAKLYDENATKRVKLKGLA